MLSTPQAPFPCLTQHLFRFTLNHVLPQALSFPTQSHPFVPTLSILFYLSSSSFITNSNPFRHSFYSFLSPSLPFHLTPSTPFYFCTFSHTLRMQCNCPKKALSLPPKSNAITSQKQCFYFPIAHPPFPQNTTHAQQRLSTSLLIAL